MSENSEAVKALSTIHDQAKTLQVLGVVTDPKAQKLLKSALGCSVEALTAHSKGDVVGASLHASKAAGYLRNSAQLHAKTLDDYAPPMVLDLAHLGKAQELHQNYVDAINEGKKNGS